MTELVGDSGQRTGPVSVLRDITKRKRAEKEVAGSQRQYQDLVESLDGIVWEINASNFRFTFVSKQSERMLGYSPERWLAELTWQDIIHPDDLDHVFATCGKAIEEGQNHVLEYRMIAADGGVVWIRDIATVVVDGDRPTKVRGVLLDITDRKRAEEALRKAHDELEMRVQERTAELTSANEQLQREISERKEAEDALRDSKLLLEKTFASLDEALFVVEPNTRTIIACNSAAERVFGYSEKEMLGRNTEFLHVDQATYKNFGRKLFPALEAAGVFHTEYQMRRKDGSILSTERTVTEIVDDSGQRTGLVSVLRDVTERKRMEEQLQVAREELESKVEHQLLRRNAYRLTFRELTVLHLVAAGKSDKEIGIGLGISPLTARKHISNILAKMDAASRTEAVARGLREGLLD